MRLIGSVLIFFFILSGCATAPRQPKEPKLICSGSYVQSMLMVRTALKDEPVKFASGVVTKDAVKLTGDYADGRAIEIIITRVNDNSSQLVVSPANSWTTREDCRQILDKIMQYCQLRKPSGN